MKKVFVLKGLDCPHCSAEIEKEVGKIDGISMSVINLINQTLTVNIDEDYKGNLFEDIKKIVYSHEPDVKVLEKHEKSETEEHDKGNIIRIGIGAAVYAASLIISYAFNLPKYAQLIIFIIPYLILGSDVVLKALRNISKGRVFDENFLMTVSSIGAFAIGEYPEAVAVMLFYQVGEYFQGLAVNRSRKSITELMDIRHDYANVLRKENVVTVLPDEVSKGEIIIVKPGEKIPLDGVVIDGESMLDTRALTGESVPKAVRKGDNALSGCISQTGVLSIEVKKEFGESTVSKIIDLVENAASKKAPTENFITTFSRYYTPVVVILAVILGVIPPLIFGGWAEWIRRSFVFLLISCPCALVISIPMTFFGGIGAASRKGVLVKGSNYLEALNKLDTIVFDKTGTLTKGSFKVTEIITSGEFSKNEVLEYAAKAESLSNHPVARSIREAYGNTEAEITDYKELSGKGISAVADGKNIIAGNEKAMMEFDVKFKKCGSIGTKVYVAIDNVYAGCIIISDEVKDDSAASISELKKLGIRKTVMLTGDDKQIAKAVADKLGIDEYYAELLPGEKVEKFESLEKGENKKIAFVGDGINDAPVLARADVGIAMGGLGSDAAIEAADVVLMTDELSKLSDAVKLAGETKKIVTQNIVFSLGMKCVFLVLGALGIAGMWVAVFGDVGCMMIAVLNAMRILKK